MLFICHKVEKKNKQTKQNTYVSLLLIDQPSTFYCTFNGLLVQISYHHFQAIDNKVASLFWQKGEIVTHYENVL